MPDELEHFRRYSRFVWGMRYLRIRYPTMSVTSWGRSPAHNATLTGEAVDSLHLEWVAVDVVYTPDQPPPLGPLTAAAREVGLTVLREHDHDHIQLGP